MISKPKDKYIVSEHPILNHEEDCFGIEQGVVKRIYSIMTNEPMGQVTIAITGEWGIGKTSVTNLLYKKLNGEKDIVIKFDPLSEGKFEIYDVIESFYLKLYSALSDEKIKKIIEKSLKSIAILSRCEIAGSVEVGSGLIPGAKANVEVKYNVDKNITDLLKLWEEEKPIGFSEQTKKINKSLSKNKYKLYIFIDEIDRLPSKYIINFLLFLRTLEYFDNLVCLICIDYEKVIIKLQKESILSLGGYDQVQSYLDKLFQVRCHVHHSRDKKISYAISKLHEIDKDCILRDILEPTDNAYEVKSELESIIDYLHTPRQINRWLINLKLNYSIIKYAMLHKLDFMSLVAATIKHPIFVDYLSKHTLEFLKNKNYLKLFINDKYKISFFDKKEIEILEIILISLGIRQFKKSDCDPCEDLIEKLKVQNINDIEVVEHIRKVLEIPGFIINFFVEGFPDEEQVSLYENFFGNKINLVIQKLTKEDEYVDELVDNLSETLNKGIVKISHVPEIEILNDLWVKKAGDDFGSDKYKLIIFFSLNQCPIENTISESCISMSEYYLHRVLRIFNIKNVDGAYNLSDFKEASISDILKKSMEEVTFKKTNIKDFKEETIKNIIGEWIDKVEGDLESGCRDVYNQKLLISIFYRYVQWSKSINKEGDAKEKLSGFVVNYVSAAKSTL